MSDVFLSYSRKDKEFVRRLEAALKASGRLIWLDETGIPEGHPDWWAQVEKAIEAADNIVFVLSPNFQESEICPREVQHAVDHGKRLIPILYQHVESRKLPLALQKPNWIHLDNFDKGVKQLEEAIATDHDYVAAHTLLETRAIEWQNQSRNSAWLLRGSNLQAAEELRNQAAGGKQPITNLQREFITASRTAARARRRNWIVGGLAVGLGLLALALVALVQSNNAISEANKRATAQAETLFEANEKATAQAQSLIDANARATAQAQALVDANAKATAEAETKKQVEIGSGRRLSQIAESLRDKQLDLALLLGVAALRGDSSVETRGSLWETLNHRPLIASLFGGHEYGLSGIAYSPTQNIVASVDEFSNIILWDADTHKQIAKTEGYWGAGDLITDIAFSPDGEQLATAQETGVAVWNVPSLENRYVLQEGSGSIAFSQNGKFIASSSGVEKSVQLWDAKTGVPVGIHLGEPDVWTKFLAFTDDDRSLVTVTIDGIQVWEVATGELLSSIETEQAKNVWSMAANPGIAVVLTGHGDGTIRLWDTILNEIMAEYKLADDPIHDVQLSPDTNYIGAVSSSAVPNMMGVGPLETVGSIHLLPVIGSSPQGVEIDMNDTGFSSIAFSGNGQHFATAGVNSTVYLWNTYQRDHLSFEIPGVFVSTQSFGFDPHGLVAWSSQPGQIQWWDLATRQAVKDVIPPQPDEYEIKSFATSPDGQKLVTLSHNNELALWNTAEQKREGTFRIKPEGTVDFLQFSPDAMHLYIISENSTASKQELTMWDVATQTQVAVFEEKAQVAAISPDGRYIAATGVVNNIDNAIFILDAQTLDPILEPLDAPRSISSDYNVHALAFSPDGKWLASAGSQDDIILWDTSSWKPSGDVMRGQGGFDSELAFSPDSKILAAGDGFNLALWEVTTHKQVISPLPSSTYELGFSPDGKFLIVSDNLYRQNANPDGSVTMEWGTQLRVWPMDVAALIERACHVANRDLTLNEWVQFVNDNPDTFTRLCPE